jgi:peptidyl-tRNA hydrolase, PTH1 family
MRVLVGLRNPGPEYEGTRHNVGFEVLAILAGRHGVRLRRGPGRTRSELGEARIDGEPAVLAVPSTYMNHSGQAVQAVLRYFKAEPTDLLVFHDDIDLPFARLRVQEGGGTGGHNGLRSIEGSLGTRDFWRLKIGVGRPPGRMDPADYVLRRFAKAERVEIDVVVEHAADVAEAWIADPEAARRTAGERTG